MRKPERRKLVVVRGWKGERRAKEVEGEESHRTTGGIALQTRSSGRIPQDASEETRERDAPPCLSQRYEKRSGVRSIRCNAPARAPGGTLFMWARTLRTSRSLCGQGPRERRGTGTTPLSSSQLRSPAPKTGRTGGGGPSGSGSPQPGREDGMGNHRRRGHAQPRALVRMGSEQPGYRATT